MGINLRVPKLLFENLLKHWQIVLSVVLISFSFTQVVTASSESHVTDDCWRVVGSCEYPGELEPVDNAGYVKADSMATISLGQVVTYQIAYWGELDGSTDNLQFAAQVAETLRDSRGWVRGGYTFNRIDTGADFTLILSEASILDTIPGCDSNWSCRSGRNVIINEDRWNGATTAWNNDGGSLRDYRHMVVNHEVGHWLGLGHYFCSDGVNGLAPVMQQQSIDLGGCKFNPWPLQFEIDLV